MLEEVRRRGARAIDFQISDTTAASPAAIIFTSGSTGPAKGVLYRHGNFDRQVTEIRDFYKIEPGEVDVPCFPLFGLFNAAMGVTSVIPPIDASRPAKADPRGYFRDRRLASNAIVRLAGNLESRRSILPGTRRADEQPSPRAFRRRSGCGACTSAHGGVHSSGRGNAHALRRDRGAAGGFDREQRGAVGNRAANRLGRRRVRGATFPRH